MRRREFITLLAGAAVAPITAHAQQNAAPVIGFLHFGSPNPFTYQTTAFEQGLKESGYVQGRMQRSNTAGRKGVMTDCLRWLEN